MATILKKHHGNRDLDTEAGIFQDFIEQRVLSIEISLVKGRFLILANELSLPY